MAKNRTRTLSSLLVGAVLCAACAHQQLSPREEVKSEMEAMHEAVGQEVHDAQRAAQLNQAIDALEAQLLAVDALGASARADVLALNSRPEATAAEFEALEAQYDARRRSLRASLIEVHLRLIDATTAEEWKRLARYERDALTVAAGF